MSSALDTQIDGTHYTDMPVQPIELAYLVSGSPAFCKAAKYLTRKKGSRLINLEKALHIVGLEQDLVGELIYGTVVKMKRPQLEILLNIFTKDQNVGQALAHMYFGSYGLAKALINGMISDEKISTEGTAKTKRV